MSQPAPLARALAGRILAITPASLPRPAIDWAACAIIDTLGVTLGGAGEDAARMLADITLGPASAAPHRVFGTPHRAGILDAVLLNAVAAHALDYDDVCDVMGGHPSAPLVAPLLALAEAQAVSGADLLAAYVAGFETEVRLGRAVHPVHYDKGWHPTSTLGTFGAAAAAAHLLRLDADATATALGLAASLTGGIKANFGTMTKPLQVGHCARNGLLAALLAQRGYTANTGALEARQGWLNVVNGAGAHDAARALADWAAPLEILAPGVGIKPFPCCGSTHAAIQLALDLCRTQHLSPAEVARLGIRIHGRRLAHINNPAPRTGLAAKYSIQYVVARAVLNGAVQVGHFEHGAWEDPAIVRLLADTTAEPDAAMQDDTAVEIAVTTQDGRTLVNRAENTLHLTRGPAGTPVTEDEMRAKFADCAARALPATQVAALFAALRRLADDGPGEILALLAAPPGGEISRRAS